jgi:uncharacterized membrane protein YhaH (DUF805 family)
MRWLINPLKRYADFTGRAPRSEFWPFLLFVTLLTVAANFIDGTGSDELALGMGALELGVSLALLAPTVAVSVRRLHDTGRSGWWTMLVYLPWLGVFAATAYRPALTLPMTGALLIGGIAWLAMMALPGNAGANAYGPPPA